MSETGGTKNIGLRGVKVADTRISDVDGEKGSLIYRGLNICDLVVHSTFEEVSFLLLHDHLPKAEELKKFQSELISEREVPETIYGFMRMMPKSAHPMDVLEAAVPILAAYDPQLHDESRNANFEKATRLIAKLPSIVAAWDRIRNGKEPVRPRLELTHAGNFLYMLSGSLPDRTTARDFDICLILHAEHSFNASTFAGREVASTHAHLYASIVAAIGALSGEIHGGANSEVMKMLLEVGEVSRVKSWVSEKLQKGGKVMGMGHAVYHTEDPRASVLRGICSRLADRTGERKWFELTKAVEASTQEEFRKLKGKEIYPNVDFYSASVYHMMGIPTDLFPPVFAISRISGWAAHIIEEKFAEAQPKPELYRPDADYVGTYCGPESCPYIPIEERSK
ncbi:MAG: 2-methylcitrate synthase/citrate synthase [Deltaproteobacteria bacterium]|nr:2-methylcitrate synthase/citrate synthase [Deltaproteobacteria bacterium]